MILLLASASPRRRALLESAGVAFTVDAVSIDESKRPEESPLEYVARVAREKALAGLAAHPDAVVLAADTVVVLENDVLGKPADLAAAKRTLRALSGRNHVVYTAVCVMSRAHVEHQVVGTDLRFRELTDAEIDAYIATGECFDKAGAYGIQGHGGGLVDHVHGSYTNVVGLPLSETLALLGRVGTSPWEV